MVTNGIKIMLSWPDPILNPNVKLHWAVKKDAKQAARDEGYVMAKQTGMELDPAKRYIMEMVFCPPDHRPRDLDNLLASQKWAIDGMCKALGINDRMIRPVPDWGQVVNGGKVEVSIVELPDVKV
jgi:Holliday junction resolvase RusA-like endonuclease